MTARILRLVPDPQQEPEKPDLTDVERAAHRVRCAAAAAIACGVTEAQVMDAAREGVRLGRALW